MYFAGGGDLVIELNKAVREVFRIMNDCGVSCIYARVFY